MSIMYFAGRSGCIRNLSDHKLEVAPLGKMGGNRMVDGLTRLMSECETFAILCRRRREQGTKHLERYEDVARDELVRARIEVVEPEVDLCVRNRIRCDIAARNMNGPNPDGID